jgi:hypothetical protein
VAVVGKFAQKYETDSYTQTEKQYTKQKQRQRIQKIENKHKKQENKHKNNIKNLSLVIQE